MSKDGEMDLGKRNLRLHGYLDEPDEGFEQGDCSSSGSSPQHDVSLSPLLRVQKCYQSTDSSPQHDVSLSPLLCVQKCYQSTDFSPQDDVSLSPLLRVQKCVKSADIFDRAMVARVIQDLFRNAPADQLTRDLPEIMKIFSVIFQEARADLLEHIPNIAVQAVENSTRVAVLKDVVSDYLIPLVVRNLGSTDTAVDKAAQATLIYLVEKGYVSKLQAEIKVCPAILALSKMESHLDVNFGAVTLMSKLAPLLGRDITERILLKRFSELCESNMFYVRKISATLLGSFCAVVGEEAFQNTLLPCYIKLCNDDIWGVRKSCAEVIMFVSSVCPAELRKSTLAPTFSKLLQDDCRWVRMSAFQTLGPFISTFANPPLTSLSYNQNGEVVLINESGSEFVLPSCSEYFHNVSVTDTGFATESGFSLEDVLFENFAESADGTGLNSLNIISSDHPGEIEKSLEPSSSQSQPKQESKSKTLDSNCNQISEKGDANASQQQPKVTSLASANDCCDTGMQPKDNLLSSYNEYNYWYISPGEIEMLDVHQAQENSCLAKSDVKVTNLESLYSAISLDDSGTEILETSQNELKKSESKCDTNANSETKTENSDLVVQKCDTNSNDSSSEITLVSNKTSEDQPNEDIKDKTNKDQLYKDIKTEDKVQNGETDNVATTELIDSVDSLEVEVGDEPEQFIVPQELINFFVSMTDFTFVSLNIDNDITYHCAYSLPAVVLTLGKENWPILKKTVDLLAGDMQYKVRRTVASSLHELALIMGPQVASEDLIPLFDGFLKDLDEVRIGILTHLAQFLSLINTENRYYILPKLGEFLRVDNVCNWRFRETLAQQLELCVRLFKPADVVKHIGLYAQALMLDKVSAVKQAALYLVTETIKSISVEHGLASSYLAVIAERFAHAKKWKSRQTFALLCSLLLQRKAVPLDEFSDEVLPHLLDLSWDPVSNVRLVVAKCFADHILDMDYFLNPENDHQQALENVLRRLQADKDSEVRKTVDQYTTYTFGICKKDSPKV